MNLPQILIIEDGRALSLALGAAVRRVNACGKIVSTAALAREHLLAEGANFAAMILDIGLPDENGLDFLASLPPACRLPTLVVTAHGEIDNTIAARKLGVSEFLTKPLDFEVFKAALKRLLRTAPAASAPPDTTAAFIGGALSMRPAFQQIAHACAADDPVLIRGETGTGKSLTSRLIHRNSTRADAPFVVFAGGNSANLTAKLVQAGDGVLVVEDVTRLDLDAQNELLHRWENPDASLPRILGITTTDLRAATEAGVLRSELFYRLQVLEIHLPPLRDRLEDLPTLLSFFLGQLEPTRPVIVDEAALQLLATHNWPGNLRELRNLASAALTVSGGAAVIEPNHLPVNLLRAQVVPTVNCELAFAKALNLWLEERLSDPNAFPNYCELSNAVEHQLLQLLLKRFDGKLARLAKALNANRSTLRRKLTTES